MPYLVKSTVATFALLIAVAASAQAQQTPNVATLPPTAATGTVPSMPAVAPSPKYVGPAPGSSDGSNGVAFQKPAAYDDDVNMHPYTAPGMGPKPH
jgi:hypothetical protein